MRGRHGRVITGFGPAVSKTAMKKMGQEVRSWRLHRRTTSSGQDLARWINPIVAGWMNYYGQFYRSELYLLRRINAYLARWMRKKYKRLRTFKKAHAAWKRTSRQYPRFFAHWRWVPSSKRCGGEEPGGETPGPPDHDTRSRHAVPHQPL